MDELTIAAAEAAVHAGLPLDAGAVLLVELDGPGARGGGAARPLHGAVPAAAAPASCGGPATSRSGPALARPQGGLRGDGPDQPRLLRAGRRRAPHPAAGDAAADRRAVRALRAARRQRLPRRRRQPAPAGALRRRGRGRAGAGRAAGVRDPDRLRRRRWLADRRARHRAGQGPAHGSHVLGGRPRRHAPAALRLRPGRPLQPRQGVPDAAAVRRGARALPASTRSSARGWPSDGDRARGRRSHLHRRGRHAAGRAAAHAGRAAARCSRSIRPTTAR